MKSKITFMLALASMVVFVFGTIPAGATDWYVSTTGSNSNGGTSWTDAWHDIQYAVDYVSVGGGDIINVAAGTYIEAVKVDKSITLQGLDGAIIRPDYTTPTWVNNKRRCGVYIAAVDNVTIDGFEIDGTGGTVHLGIFPSNSNNTVVKNNVIHDITNEIDDPGNDSTGVGILFFGWGQGIDNAVIENNTVYHTGRMGIIVCAMNAVTDKWELCNNNVIKNNVVHDAWQGPTEDSGGAIQINGAMNSSIEGNTIFDTGKPTDGWLYTGIYICGSAASSIPNCIEGNDMFDNYIGIVIWSDDSGVNFGTNVPGAPEVHFNNIYNSTRLGMFNRDWKPAYEVDATCNWWGNVSGPSNFGPGSGDAVSGNVDFEPWLLAKDGECEWFDEITSCAITTKNHGQFVKCVIRFTNELVREDKITEREAAAIISWAAALLVNIP